MDSYMDKKLKDTINCIFQDYNINDLSLYEKRKMVFDYLVDNLKYDYELLDKIKDFKISKIRVKRDLRGEFIRVLDDGLGICSSISQCYKFLLERVGIKSYCVICDDGTNVRHQLNLVYDMENDTYSFDDVTSVIVGKGTKEDFFDYDLSFANYIGQGNKYLINDRCFVFLPEEWLNTVVRRKNGLCETLEVLPKDIVSMKKRKRSFKI